MSSLHSGEVLQLIASNELVISPILSKDQIGPISIDLRLGNVALMVRSRGLSHVDPTSYIAAESDNPHQQEQGKRQKLERHEIPFQEALLLHPGTLALVPTLEWVKLPSYIKGTVTARSSWAREGLSIATANFINPGYNGIITLELANLGQIPIAIYPGMRIAQIAFDQVKDDGNEHNSKGQFDLSFEPRSGEITKNDEPFIPRTSH